MKPFPNQNHSVAYNTMQSSPSQQQVLNQENRIIQLVRNLDKRIKAAEKERKSILRIIAHLQTHEELITDSEKYPVNGIDPSFTENKRRQNSFASVKINNKNISIPPEQIDAAFYFHLHNPMQKLRTLANHCREYLQTSSYSNQNDSKNPAHQPEIPTTNNVPKFFPKGCSCMNLRSNDGFSMCYSNSGTTDITHRGVEKAFKRGDYCKTLLGNSTSTNPVSDTKFQVHRAVKVATSVKPHPRISNANKTIFSNNKYCSGRCYHCKENQWKINMSPVIYTVTEYSSPMKKVAWR
ncbi:unnamed protein product [Schistosoma turkestanicum]|nr:unnamed protein product [Schistosoma turkestanicum]